MPSVTFLHVMLHRALRHCHSRHISARIVLFVYIYSIFIFIFIYIYIVCLILHIIYIRSLLFPFFKFNRWFPRTLRVRSIPFHIYSYIFHSRLSGSYIYVSSPIGIYIWIPICFYLNCPCSIWIHIQIRASRLLEYIYIYIYILHIMQSSESHSVVRRQHVPDA